MLNWCLLGPLYWFVIATCRNERYARGRDCGDAWLSMSIQCRRAEKTRGWIEFGPIPRLGSTRVQVRNFRVSATRASFRREVDLALTEMEVAQASLGAYWLVVQHSPRFRLPQAGGLLHTGVDSLAKEGESGESFRLFLCLVAFTLLHRLARLLWLLHSSSTLRLQEVLTPFHSVY